MDLAVPVLAVLAAVVLTLGLWADRQQRAGARAWARRHGWRHTRRAPVPDLRGGPFGTGAARTVTDVVDGSYAGRAARSFAYSFRVTLDGPARTYRYHVVQLALPAVLPTVELLPQGAPTRAVRLLGARGVELELEDFNRAWYVRTGDPRAAYGLLHPRMMDRLMRPDLRGHHLLVEGGTLTWWGEGDQDVGRIGPLLERLTALAELVPAHLWQEGAPPHRA